MAGPTARLALYKHDYGAILWHTLLNAGFDLADARLLKISSDYSDQPDPNTPSVITGDYVGQKYIDETVNPPRVWYCTTAAGASSVWRLISTNGVRAPAAIGGNVILDTILQDFQSRINALEATPIPPRGHIDGLTTSWGTGATAGDTVEFAAGECADSTKVRYLTPAAMGKRIDQSWVPGDGNGGLSSSLTLTLGTWYHKFAIRVGSSDDFGFDTSPIATNLIADHSVTHFSRIGAFKTLSSGAPIIMRRWFQNGDLYCWYDVSEESGISWWALDNAAVAPTEHNVTFDTPLGIKVPALVTVAMRDAAGEVTAYLYSPDAMGDDPDYTEARISHTLSPNLAGSPPVIGGSGHSVILTGLTSNIKARFECGGSFPRSVDQVRVCATGWIDPRGRNL